MSVRPLEVRYLGRRPYTEVWALQKSLLVPIAEGEAPETLLLVEHEPVLTLGRKAGAAGNVLDAGGWEVVETERGGDVTYHGPGQLVGYPLVHLREGERDLHRYLRHMEECLIRALGDFGLEGRREEGLTGVWIADRKVASMGVAVKRWVTYHGFALNVTADLGHFARINPCGLASTVMGSMQHFLGAPVALEAVAERIVAHLPETLGRTGVWSLSPPALEKTAPAAEDVETAPEVGTRDHGRASRA